MKLDRVKHSLKRGTKQFRDASLFVVATEGEKTEAVYLNSFHSSRIKVFPVICDDGRSSPEGVLERLTFVMKSFQFGENDSFWMLIDRDQWSEQMLSAVNSNAKKLGVQILCSNRRFEVFLCAHFEGFEDSDEIASGQYELFLRKNLGSFNKSSYDCIRVREGTQLACNRCEATDDQTTELWPPEHTSRVYRLVKALLAKI
jgi:hypothetical protein